MYGSPCFDVTQLYDGLWFEASEIYVLELNGLCYSRWGHQRVDVALECGAFGCGAFGCAAMVH